MDFINDFINRPVVKQTNKRTATHNSYQATEVEREKGCKVAYYRKLNMVVVDDFEFQLVSADGDANTPFMEHENNLKTYVEVEPDAEDFLSVRKVWASSSVLCCTFYLGDKHLGYCLTQFHPQDRNTERNLFHVLRHYSLSRYRLQLVAAVIVIIMSVYWRGWVK